jgi:hypothetical protein
MRTKVRTLASARASTKTVAPQRTPSDVGWTIQNQKASLIWSAPVAHAEVAPTRFLRKLPRAASSKSVQVCPAALDFDARHFVVPCPVDLHLKINMGATPDAEPTLINAAGPHGSIRSKHLGQMVAVVARREWRHPARPIIQVVTPYLFLADEPTFINQLPPYLDYVAPARPGVMIAGRFPIHIWPRELMWAFEWYDTTQELQISRGDPWFYLRFETSDPSRPVRLFEADIKPDVQVYLDSLSGVTNYVSQTYSLFDVAKQRRPQQLLFRKVRN